MVDGGVHVRLVPHVNRQEMYSGGKNLTDSTLKRFESPINLFGPDFKAYPNVQFVN